MTQTSRPDAAAAPERQRDKERTRQEILDVAIREFAGTATRGRGWTRSPPGPGPPSG